MESSSQDSSGQDSSGQPTQLSRREACDLLRERAGIDRETARRVLAAGLAGPGIRLRGSILHDRAAVESLASRPLLGPWMPEVCRQGTFVARLGQRRADASAPEAEQLRAASGPWRLSALARVKLHVMVDGRGFLPFVATTGGFVVLGAEVVGVTGAHLSLRPPGDWFDSWRGGRLPTAPGPPWQMWPTGLWELASSP